MTYEMRESPNQNLRKKAKIDMIVIHATASDNMNSSIDWLRSPKSNASAHYIIDRDGKIIQLVPESKKAWHAGKSRWKDEEFLNENSIGIELVNKNNGTDEYPDDQINALAHLIYDIQTFYVDITDDRIVGHNQIAPERKSDPNINFPWVKLGVLLQKLRG